MNLPPGVSLHAATHGGEVGRLIEELDWSATPLGARSTWPATLLGYIRMILELPAPAIVFWGAEQTQIYNDGYAVIMGPRHPRHLGGRYADCWPETHATIYPWMRAVLDRGDTVAVNRSLIPMSRHGFDEDAYFTFSFTPLVDDAGAIAGILQIVTEVTDTVLAERRAATLRRISAEGTQTSLDENRDDVPFHSIHVGDDATNARVPVSVVAAVRKENRAQRVDDALVLPIRRSESEVAKGVVVLGISPRLHFDANYEGFLQAVSREIAASLAADEERAAREQADLERRNLADYFAQAPIPICIFEAGTDVADLRFMLANEPYTKLVGREVVGAKLSEVVDPNEITAFIPLMHMALKSGEDIVAHELPFRDRLLDVVYRPVRESDGNVRRLMAFVQDVTEPVQARKRVERLADELRVALAMRDDFLSIASHELRTPITAMKLQADVLRRHVPNETDLDPRLQKFVAQMAKGLERLRTLVEDMLDIARIQGGRLQLRAESLNLSEVAHDALELLSDQLSAAGITITTTIPEVAMVMADRGRLDQVLINVLSNAIRYAPHAPLEMRIVGRDDGIELSIRDGGPGIAPEDHERIFSRFERLPSATAVGGLGLGLYIARGMMEAQGGSLRVESTKEQGARFVLSLPRPL